MVEGQGGSAEGISAGISAADVLGSGEQAAEQVVAAEGAELAAEGVEVEAKVEETKPEASKQEKLFASKFAALSRKEKAIRQREAQLEAKMAELEARLNQSTQAPAAQEVEEPLDRRLKKDPFKTLESMGMDYETLTKIALNDGKLPPEIQARLMQEELERKYEEKFRELESKLTEKEQKEQEQKHAQVIENFKGEIADFVASNVESLEMLSVEGEEGVELIYNVIEEHYNQTGEVLDKRDAAELVEEHLIEEAKKRIGLSKIKKLLGASEVSPKNEPKQTKSSVTLSNTQSQVSQTGDRFLSDDESKAQAAKLIKWVE